MVESSKNCPACHSVVRPNAMFCHHCGRPLLVDVANSPAVNTQSLTAENLSTESETVLAEPQTVLATAAAPIETPEKNENQNGTAGVAILPESAADNIFDSESGEIAAAPVAIEKNIKQAGATIAPAVLPRRAKSYVSRTEYVWEDAKAPTWRVVLFSLLILVAVIVLLWLNNFLR